MYCWVILIKYKKIAYLGICNVKNLEGKVNGQWCVMAKYTFEWLHSGLAAHSWKMTAYLVSILWTNGDTWDLELTDI